jgi:hypothetical protein
MDRSTKRTLILIAAPVALVAACSAAGTSSFTTTGGNPGGAGATGPSTGTTGISGGGGMVNLTVGNGVGTGSGMSTASGSNCTVTDMNADMDGDGWTPAEGDCDDCDPNVNPGAIDVWHDVDGGMGFWGNEACDNSAGVQPCDSNLALDDTNADDGARAIELCSFTTESPALPKKVWGVISAEYTRADGTPFSPGLQVGLQPGWGPNVHPQGGKTLLAISSGYARTPSQPNACGSLECDSNFGGTAPPGFPLDNPNCPATMGINDDVGLKMKIRAPTNATGFSFSFKFNSFEFPQWVCDSYNDQFIALVQPAPSGSLSGDISFDSTHHPVSVNLAFFNVCDPKDISEFGENCQIDNFGGTCPNPPNPYCPSGTSELIGTGFDLWNQGVPIGGGKHAIAAGATSWLTSQAPVKGGEEFNILFAMWDATDQAYDSTTLIDNFKWIADGSSVVVVTTPIPMPQ